MKRLSFLLLVIQFFFFGCRYEVLERIDPELKAIYAYLMQPPVYTVGGTVTGLTADGLVLQNNGGDNLTVPNGATSFTFATGLFNEASYAVTILTQPTGLVCAVTEGTGSIAQANVTSVTVTCTPEATPYTVGGTITGLTQAGLVLQNNGGQDLTVASEASTFTFPTGNANGAAYNVTVSTQPAGGLTCTVSNGTGTIAGASVTNIAITCSAAPTFTVGGTITGLNEAGLVLQNNGGDNLTVASGATSFTFATSLANGAAYNVSVSTQPGGGLNCNVTNGAGTVSSANVTNITIACSNAPTYTIGGTITGLSATGLVLRNNGGNNLTVANGATTFTFSTALSDGSTYNVTVGTQPTGLTCTVTNGTGTLAGANVTNVSVACVAPSISYAAAPIGATRGTSLLTTATLTNITPTSCTSNPTLPAGLSLAATTCTLSGTPTAETPRRTYRITASDGTNSPFVDIVIDVRICYDWGCFRDNGNGTVTFTGAGGATNYGGYNYDGLILHFQKCGYGQTFNSTTNACDGTVDLSAPVFCATNDNSCNGGTNDGTLVSGPAFDACNAMNTAPAGGFAGRTNWRVPTVRELKSTLQCPSGTLPDDAAAGGVSYCSPLATAVAVNALFTQTGYGFVTSSSANATNPFYVSYVIGTAGAHANTLKSYTLFALRCVAPN